VVRNTNLEGAAPEQQYFRRPARLVLCVPRIVRVRRRLVKLRISALRARDESVRTPLKCTPRIACQLAGCEMITVLSGTGTVAGKEMSEHDHSYKLLFSHPQMVRDLLEDLFG
jgi:hypothetical protein